jgi:hypothetical protein
VLLRIDSPRYRYLVVYVFSRPRRAFCKIVCGLYEEMKRKDENRALGSWILARNFLKKLF